MSCLSVGRIETVRILFQPTTSHVLLCITFPRPHYLIKTSIPRLIFSVHFFIFFVIIQQLFFRTPLIILLSISLLKFPLYIFSFFSTSSVHPSYLTYFPSFTHTSLFWYYSLLVPHLHPFLLISIRFTPSVVYFTLNSLKKEIELTDTNWWDRHSLPYTHIHAQHIQTYTHTPTHTARTKRPITFPTSLTTSIDFPWHMYCPTSCMVTAWPTSTTPRLCTVLHDISLCHKPLHLSDTFMHECTALYVTPFISHVYVWVHFTALCVSGVSMDEECGPLHDGFSSGSHQLGQPLELGSHTQTRPTAG